MKRGVKTIIVGIGLFVLAALAIPLIILGCIVLKKSDAVQFKVPGTAEANIEKPGRYYLWNDFETVYNGKSYHHSESLPDGMGIKITDTAGAALTFVSDTSISSTTDNSSKHTIGYIEVGHPCKVEIAVTGGDSVERVFSFGRFDLVQIFGLVFGSVLLCMVLALGGIAIGIWGVVKLTRSGK